MIYIGIDDTDNLSTQGTCILARELGKSLHRSGLIDLDSVTGHQLLNDGNFRMTHRNHSASITGNSPAPVEEVIAFIEEFLYNECASGSNAGVCIAMKENIDESVGLFGKMACEKILDIALAQNLAKEKGIYLKGLSHKKNGIIGALAAVGLAWNGAEGHMIWQKNMPEGVHPCMDV
jgi:tRNA(Ile2) C34 agmatinyltransferase TiaS